MSNGLAYHFVIGNGSSSGNGEIEIGSRWTRQINGGHVASDYLNNIAIGNGCPGPRFREMLQAWSQHVGMDIEAQAMNAEI